MGYGYVLMPISGDDVRDWLAKEGLDPPSGPSRLPGASELRQVLEELAGAKVVFSDSGVGWDADIGSEITIWVRSGTEPDTIASVSFHKPSDFELMARIAERLARSCGPLLLICDNDARPVIVTAGADPAAIVARLLT